MYSDHETYSLYFFQDVASSISTSTSCENRLWFSCCHIWKGGILLILCGIYFLFARLPYSTSQIHVPYEHTKKTKTKVNYCASI